MHGVVESYLPETTNLSTEGIGIPPRAMSVGIGETVGAVTMRRGGGGILNVSLGPVVLTPTRRTRPRRGVGTESDFGIPT